MWFNFPSENYHYSNIYSVKMHTVRKYSAFQACGSPSTCVPAGCIDSGVGAIRRAYCGDTFSGCNEGSLKSYNRHLSGCSACVAKVNEMNKIKKDKEDAIKAEEQRIKAEIAITRAAEAAIALTRAEAVVAELAAAEDDDEPPPLDGDFIEVNDPSLRESEKI